MKRLILLSLVTALLYQSCDRAKTVLFRSYINTYFYNRNIRLKITEAGNIAIYRETSSEYKTNTPSAVYSFESKGEEKKRYDELCRIHNDMNYNQKRSYIKFTGWGSMLRYRF